MKFTELVDNAKLSRRKLLKGMGAIAAVATVSGCSSDDGNPVVYDPTESALLPSDNLTFDTSMKQYFSTGGHNCGARCVHKVHVKNGRILKFTSDGDIPRDQAHKDEWVGDVNGAWNKKGEREGRTQRRACVRGYGYIQRLYQPDKLKYPMMQLDDNGNYLDGTNGWKGNVNNFRRVTWARAVDAAAELLAAAIRRKADLGYSPILHRGVGSNPYFKFPQIAPAVVMAGNESYGGVDAGKFDTVGPNAVTNNISDRLNTKFIMTWALDSTRTTYWLPEDHWFRVKMKEAGIPAVCISSNYSDTAAMYSTGVKGFKYTPVGLAEKTVDIPGWIACRPATDGALAAAMAYVIYKNNIMDSDYMGTWAAPKMDKTFGFWANQTHVSTAPCLKNENGAPELSEIAGSEGYKPTPSGAGNGTYMNMRALADFTDDAATPKSFKQGDSYNGTTFTVPQNKSYSEYLDHLEVEWVAQEQMLVDICQTVD